MAPAEPLLVWTDPPREIIGFLASYLPLGAVGYYFAVLRPTLRQGFPGSAALTDSAPRAARIGLVGVLCGALALLISVIGRAEHTGLGFSDTVILMRGPVVQRILLVTAVGLGFVLALLRRSWGWIIAALGALWIQLNGLPQVFSGRWFGIVNPIHVLGGSLWLGTLFVMMVAGVGIALQADAGERDAAVGTLVRRFSAIALVGAGLLGITGVITAWRHLHRWSSLWTTPYGWTLDAKLVVVLLILTLGFYHWRTVRLALGSTPESVVTFRKTAWRELKLAGLVLVITSVLVSLPSPRSRPEGGPGGPGTARFQGPPPGRPGGPPPGGDRD